VNTAVTQMDKVTQSNAAAAEESASASEELAAQATTMTGVVRDLMALVGTREAAPAPPVQARPRSAASKGPAKPMRIAPPSPAAKPHGGIPLDDDDEQPGAAGDGDFAALSGKRAA
jgi:methyl-accepting chemotaxis protein